MIDVPMSDEWRNCIHRFEEVDSESGKDFLCWCCGCPGEWNRETMDIDWPTT